MTRASDSNTLTAVAWWPSSLRGQPNLDLCACNGTILWHTLKKTAGRAVNIWWWGKLKNTSLFTKPKAFTHFPGDNMVLIMLSKFVKILCLIRASCKYQMSPTFPNPYQFMTNDDCHFFVMCGCGVIHMHWNDMIDHATVNHDPNSKHPWTL